MIERAAALRPDSEAIIDTLGWLRYKQGRFVDSETAGDGAITLLKRAIDLSEGPEPEMLDHYGDALWRAGRHDEATEQWRAARQRLEAPRLRQMFLQAYQRIQIDWGLLVMDPRLIYDRQIVPLRERIRDKLEAVAAGEDPPLAATFADAHPNPPAQAEEGVQPHGRSQ